VERRYPANRNNRRMMMVLPVDALNRKKKSTRTEINGIKRESMLELSLTGR